MKRNLREALHCASCGICPSQMWRKIQEVHPMLAEAGSFIDWQIRASAVGDADRVQEVGDGKIANRLNGANERVMTVRVRSPCNLSCFATLETDGF